MLVIVQSYTIEPWKSSDRQTAGSSPISRYGSYGFARTGINRKTNYMPESLNHKCRPSLKEGLLLCMYLPDSSLWLRKGIMSLAPSLDLSLWLRKGIMIPIGAYPAPIYHYGFANRKQAATDKCIIYHSHLLTNVGVL